MMRGSTLLCACSLAVFAGAGFAATNSTYVILTTTNVIQDSTQLTNFVAHKESQGFDVQIVSNTVWGAGTGDAAANAIRGWLQQNYTNENGTHIIDYVLLIGNPHPSQGAVPMKLCHPVGTYEYPTDFFYAELTCDWNLGGDTNKWGEWAYDFNLTNDCPTATEVYVGRIPYYGVMSDLDAILQKIISYENASRANLSWRGNALLPIDKTEINMNSEDIGEWAKEDAMIPQGWAYHRVYDRNRGSGPDTMPCVADNVVAVWTNSLPGAVFWFSHGSPTSTGPGGAEPPQVIDLNHVSSLDDSHPVFTFQGCCWNAKPTVTNNLAYSILRHGGVSTIGDTEVATYIEWTLPWKQPEHTPGYVFGYASNLVARGWCAARSLQEWKSDNPPTGSPFPAGAWRDALGFNVYGCPAASPYVSGGSGGPIWSF
jgi:hypothetical protein